MPRPPSLAALHRSLGIPADYSERRGLPVYREARRTVLVARAADDNRPVRLTPRAAAAWRRMQTAAARDGVTLLPLSGFRSIARQAAIIRRKLRAGENIGAILRFVAAPGCSEHHTGRALDIGSPAGLELKASFALTKEYRWLRKHASSYGFRLSYPRGNAQGFGYEPWHWCWDGRPH